MAEILIKKIIKKEVRIEKIISKKCELLIYSFYSGEDNFEEILNNGFNIIACWIILTEIIIIHIFEKIPKSSIPKNFISIKLLKKLPPLTTNWS